MNTLGVIKQFEELIKQGYGYSQLLDKLNLTEQNLKDMVAEYPAFALVIKSRYGVTIEPTIQEEQPKPTKPLKRKKKEEQPQEQSNEEVTNANETVSEGQ